MASSTKPAPILPFSARNAVPGELHPPTGVGEEEGKKSRNQPGCYPLQPLKPPTEHAEMANSIPPTQDTLSAAADAATDDLSLGQEERRGEKDPKSNTCLLLTAREYTLAVLKLAHKRGFKHRGSRDTNPPRRDVRTEGAGAG